MRKRAPWILSHASQPMLEALPRRFVSGETLPYLGRNVILVVESATRVRLRSGSITGGSGSPFRWDWMTATATSRFDVQLSDGTGAVPPSGYRRLCGAGGLAWAGARCRAS